MSKPAELAEQLLLLKEGAIVMAHLGDPDKVADDMLRMADTLITVALDQ